MNEAIDGFYSALFSGKAGEGSAMFVLRGGVLVGADPLGVKFDGIYEPAPDGSFSGSVEVRIPPGAEVVQGHTTGPDGMTYKVDVLIPADFETTPYLSLNTPLGPVNFRLSRVRGL